MMTLAQLKQFFRQKIKVVPGGPPVGTVGSNRSQGVLDVLDKLAEELKAPPVAPGASNGFSYAFRPNGDLLPSPELADYIDAGGKIYWISPDASGQRTTVQAKSFGVAPGNTASANAAGMDALRTNLLGQ